MKPNVKSAGALKSFFLTHGEKLGMLLVLAAAGWVLYTSLAPEGESRKPQDLATRVSSSRSAMNDFTVEQALDTPDPEFGIKKEEEWQPIPLAAVDPEELDSGKVPWIQTPRPKQMLREDPVLLAAIDIEGHGGTALMATVDAKIAQERMDEAAKIAAEKTLDRQNRRDRDQANNRRGDAGRGRGGRGEFSGGGALREGQRPVGVSSRRRRSMGVSVGDEERVDLVSFAVVTALVPVEDQMKLFEDRFGEARGYNAQRDLPRWVGYQIERTEVGAAEEKWRPVGVRDSVNGRQYPIVFSGTVNRLTLNWVDGMEPLMDQEYVHPELTMPLLPLVGKNLGRDAIHSSVPLQRETDAREATEERVDPDEATGDNPLDQLGGAEAGVRGEFGGRGDRARGGRRGRSGFNEFGGREGGAAFEGRGREFGGRGGRGIGGQGVQMGGDYTYQAPYAMVRFFDLSVQAGKRYQYRVKLILKDPNHKSLVSGSYLSKQVRERVESAKDDFLRTDWSEPSAVVSIPAAGDVLVDNVKPASARSPNDEPTASLLVRSFDVDDNNRGRQAEKIMPFQRGSVLNKVFGEDEIELLAPGGRYLQKGSFTFKTNVTVVDIDGGEKLNREMARPGRVLLMDSTGKLMVRDELEGIGEVELHKQIFAEEESRSRRGREDRGRGGRGGRGGGEFGGDFFDMGR